MASLLSFGLTDDEVQRLQGERQRHRKEEQRQKRQGLFLAGPVPVEWLTQALKLGSPALKVGLELWLLRGMTKSLVVRPNASRSLLGLSRRTFQRGLQRLANGGLIRAQQRVGKKTLVALLVSSDYDPSK